MKEIRWHGRGGQGAFTASKLLGAAAVKEGKYALAFPSFGPERRGAPIQAFTKISNVPISDRSVIQTCDYILFLDDTLYQPEVQKDLKAGGKIILNTAEPEKYKGKQVVTLNANQIAEEILHRPVSNTAMLAALAVISGEISIEELISVLPYYLSAKIVAKNEAVIRQVESLLKGGSLS